MQDELADGRGATLLGRNAEFPQRVAQSAWVHRLARAAAGEEPAGSLVDGRGVGGQGLDGVVVEGSTTSAAVETRRRTLVQTWWPDLVAAAEEQLP
ncbi:hypothetical protein [Streptomyces sp. NPDC056387]|uniref:hypothetical protein n=1 Tax=Streptomyces sp. NPDC056387 TaxID=3345803 RepID=UPI0035E354E8